MKPPTISPTKAEAFFERTLSARLENGGRIEITSRGDSVSEVVELLTVMLPQIKFDGTEALDFSLCYWHLTEDLVDVEITTRDLVLDFDSKLAEAITRGLIRKVVKSFLAALARNNIQLRGERGEL